MDNVFLVGTLTAPPSPWGAELIALAHQVDYLEVRADLVGDLSPEWIRNHFNGPLLYTLRSRSEGGYCEAPSEERRTRLLKAAQHYDLIDLEANRDLALDLVDFIPHHKRLISWSGGITDFRGFNDRIERITTTPAKLYKITSAANSTGEGLAPLTALRTINRRDVIAYATGQAGLWSRLLAPNFGAPFLFGVVSAHQNGLSEPTMSQLIEDYGLPRLPHLGGLYGIIGNPVSHSLSPRLHNAAYRALGFPGLFVPFHEENFHSFWQQMVQSDRLESLQASVKGLTVASPHKEAALNSAARSSSTVRRAGATNIFIKNGNGWTADTTDPQGVIVALSNRGISVKGQKVAVVGCGGAGRAVAATLHQFGADVTLVNRGMERGIRAQSLLGLPFISLSRFSADDCSILVNATPVGRRGEALPFDLNRMPTDGIVIDLAYGQEPTPLVTRAFSLGLRAINGLEVLLIQVLHQFRLMTRLEMPLDLAREKLGILSSAAAD
jgi:3-dehydroquinate dehydratase/shikimate dehydrogenase